MTKLKYDPIKGVSGTNTNDVQHQSIRDPALWLGYSDQLPLCILFLVMKYLRLWHFWAMTELKYDPIKGARWTNTNECSYMMMQDINL